MAMTALSEELVPVSTLPLHESQMVGAQCAQAQRARTSSEPAAATDPSVSRPVSLRVGASTNAGLRLPPVGNATSGMGAAASKTPSPADDDGLAAMMMATDDAPSLTLCQMQLGNFRGTKVDSSEFAPARSAAGLLMDWEQRWEDGVMRWKRLGRRIPPQQPLAANARGQQGSIVQAQHAGSVPGDSFNEYCARDTAQGGWEPPALFDAAHMDPKLAATGSLVAEPSRPHNKSKHRDGDAGLTPRQKYGGLISSGAHMSSSGLASSLYSISSSHPLHVSPRKPAPPPLQHTPAGVGYLDNHGVLRYRRRHEYFGDRPSAYNVVTLARMASTLPHM